ncbi:MAG: riboflavin biosynthesis protein RibF [Eubacteriales bacterium]|nr:riboflavin biosynthesis protein RibF [Clostridiales bacterium]MDY5835594.1 riboflavin biosynthesis protein RibF [Eubacteriales bacterium]
MKIYQSLNFKPQTAGPRVLAMGFFDGVHKGHQQLLRQISHLSREQNLLPAVLTFSQAPAEVFRRPHYLGLIQTMEERFQSLAEYGAEEIFALPLTPELAQMAPWAFLEKYVLDQLQAQALVVGEDYSFGRGGQGKVACLQEFCQVHALSLTVVKDYIWQGQVVSSSLIRQCLQAGQVREALDLMGRPFCHHDQVVEGRKLGRRLGFPTLNVKPAAGQVSLAPGVYLTRVYWQGQGFDAVTNVGRRPTIEDEGPLLSESFLLGEDYPQYGDTVRVDYLDFLRPERKFPSLQALQVQVQQDIQEARQAHAALRSKI